MDTFKLRKDLLFYWERILDIFYPVLCIVCGHRTHSAAELYCMDCQYQLHPTGMYKHKENEFTAHFMGRTELESGAALYYYIKGGRFQQAIQLLKYKNRADIGLRLGAFYGMLLRDFEPYRSVDLIIPVPLHPKRQIQRGYNQSAMISQGLSSSMHIPWKEDILTRKKETYTQTEKNRQERLRNMQSVFELNNAAEIQGKHILLVDDILTTGATLEACASVLKKAKSVKISMATLAIAT
ncbi:MAG: ComF family protein [Saprospiraceae bacterium]|nr:ComF family protein [Saprospiraceae bacterium]MBK9720106.1 ComF family protein [Saprospiraceae bacterium]